MALPARVQTSMYTVDIRQSALHLASFASCHTCSRTTAFSLLSATGNGASNSL